MKSCGSRKGSRREMGNYEFNWSGLSQGSVDNKLLLLLLLVLQPSPSMKSLHFWTVSQPVTDIILIVLRITLPSCLTQKALSYATYDGFKNLNISTLKSNQHLAFCTTSVHMTHELLLMIQIFITNQFYILSCNKHLDYEKWQY